MTRIACFAFVWLSGLALAAHAAPEGPAPGGPGRGRIGIQVQPMTPELREHLKAPAEAGVLVVRVDEGSPAAGSGIRVGDVVTSAGGERVDSPHDLIARIAQVPEGGKIALELVRDGRGMKLEVAPAGPPLAGHPGMERWMPGGHPGMADLERRLDELEQRVRELEQR